MSTLRRYVFAIISSYAAGLVSYVLMGANALQWYADAAKPPLTPPAWVFLPVWLVLYGLMGLALGAVWSKLPQWSGWVGLYYVSLAFNASWTLFSFGLHSIFIALIDIACLAVLLIVLMLTAWEEGRRASLLLIPYLGWIFFAAYLNAGMWLLN